ncbi:hypothetical protein ASD64_07210 [Mesorhizobium sp. Root157]|uniref:regulatory protein GemA n=1 Tax=Mesorhizobium sp. Root157 TaxID=1736477 RepID=UPI0006FE7967|nr:regulatory protein GemA [Mesorhizobium sp. Root157]KQZ87219.1 hypothetical protein ASD64_07210 [Mesorhizobium sp. Root157]
MSALAAIHVAKKQLGLDDDTYRAALVNITGKASTRDMTEAERNKVVAAFRDRGFKPASTGSRKRLEGKYSGKLQALWIAGWNLGVVHNRDDKALIAFVERQTGLSHVRFLHDPADAAKAIEALKSWIAREARVDWSTGFDRPDWLRVPGAQVAIAQWQILLAAEAFGASIADFHKFVSDQGSTVYQMADQDWQPVMNALGEQVRKVRR